MLCNLHARVVYEVTFVSMLAQTGGSLHLVHLMRMVPSRKQEPINIDRK